MTANKITGANSGGPHRFQIRTSLTAHVAEFWRYDESRIQILSEGLIDYCVSELSISSLRLCGDHEAGCSIRLSPEALIQKRQSPSNPGRTLGFLASDERFV